MFNQIDHWRLLFFHVQYYKCQWKKYLQKNLLVHEVKFSKTTKFRMKKNCDQLFRDQIVFSVKNASKLWQYRSIKQFSKYNLSSAPNNFSCFLFRKQMAKNQHENIICSNVAVISAELSSEFYYFGCKRSWWKRGWDREKKNLTISTIVFYFL